MNIKFTLAISALLIFIGINRSFSQDTVKIMGYNLLNYSAGEARNVYFKKTLSYTSPDVLSVCEILSEAAMNDMLVNVLNANSPGLYSAGTFLDGPDTDNAIFYKSSKFTYVSNTPRAPTAARIKANLITMSTLLS